MFADVGSVVKQSVTRYFTASCELVFCAHGCSEIDTRLQAVAVIYLEMFDFIRGSGRVNWQKKFSNFQIPGNAGTVSHIRY